MLAPASRKQAMMLQSEAQITVLGGSAGSGKTYLTQMIPLKYIDDPNTRVICFRRTTVQVKGQGGLYDTHKDICMQLPKEAQPTFKDSKMETTFPSGATIHFSHMEYEKDKFNHQGLQYSLIVFDEGCAFTQTQIEYLMSRMRSKSKYKSRMVVSCNPDNDHIICEWINWYLDDEGYPIPERDGVVRYFVRKGGDYVWGDSAEELKERFGEGTLPISFTFISATIRDNPPLIEANPEYLSMLEGLPPLEKAQLLHGCWYAREEGANYFQRNWLEKVDKLPLGCKSCRGWDKASEAPNQKNKTPDFTASTRMHKDKDGFYYITGDAEDCNYDKDYEVYGKFRKTPGERDSIIEKQALADGSDTVVVLPVDPGAAGKVEYQQSAKKLIEAGIQVAQDPAPNNANKLTKFTPFSSAAENGLVRIVESTFRDKRTLDMFYKELEAFDGTRSTAHRKDDNADSTATAFNYLSKQQVVSVTGLTSALNTVNARGVGSNAFTNASAILKHR